MALLVNLGSMRVDLEEFAHKIKQSDVLLYTLLSLLVPDEGIRIKAKIFGLPVKIKIGKRRILEELVKVARRR